MNSRATLLLASALAGVAMALAFPPMGWWPLVLAGLAPLIWISQRRTPGQALAAGFVFGLAMFLTQLYWITVALTVYGQVAWPLALLALAMLAVILSSYTALFAWATARLARAGLTPLVAAPLAWMALEWLRGMLLTGFPWLPLATGLIPALPLMQSAELWGGEGLGALVVLVNALLARAALGWAQAGRLGWREAACLAGVAALLAGGWAGGAARLDTVRAEMAGAPKLTVSVVQGNIPLEQMWVAERRLANLEEHIRLTDRAAEDVKERPWLVVWSESSAPFYFLAPGRPTQPVLDAAGRLRAWILTGTLGTVRRDGKLRPTNRSWMVRPDGRPDGYYDKVHLVPFGEYVPLEDLLFFVRAVAMVGENSVPGPKGHTLDLEGVKVGPLICYESIFPELARAQAARGARLLVNQTNDSWYGRTGASAQHLSHLVLRAIETRLAVARSANTGISAFVLPTGRVVDRTGLFEPAVRTRRLPLMSMSTAYVAWGGWLGPLALLAVALALAWSFMARRRG